MSRRVSVLALSLMLALPAWSKNPSKMSDDELVAALREHKSRGVREKAAEEIGERRVEGAIPTLRAACDPREEQSVCERSVKALEKYRSPESQEALSEIIKDERLDTWWRQEALRALRRVNPTLLGQVAVEVLVDFRNLRPPFAKNLVEALVGGSNVEARDLTILIARDVGTARPVRVAALEAAETFRHPRLYEAYADLIDDTDQRIRVKCIEGLDRAGLPPMVVRPPLLQVAQNDNRGGVRAKAWKALRNVVSPALLPAVNKAVEEERNLFALGHILAIFTRLADESSIPVIERMLRGGHYTGDYRVELIHILVRLGDPAVLPTLEFVVDNASEPKVRDEAQRAIEFLRGPEEARVTFVAGFPSVDVVFVEDHVEYEAPPALSVSLDASGRVVLPGASVEVRVEGGQ